MINLGDRVKDRITGFKGIATSRTYYLTGCNRIGILPEGLHDGKTIDTHFFDESQVELIKAGVVRLGQQENGGPQPSPKRSSNPH